MNEYPSENSLFKDQNPAELKNHQDLLDLLLKNDYASQLLDENEIEPLELVQDFACLYILDPNEFDFHEFVMEISHEEDGDAFIARRVIKIMLDLELIQRSDDKINFHLNQEMYELSKRMWDDLDF